MYRISDNEKLYTMLTELSSGRNIIPAISGLTHGAFIAENAGPDGGKKARSSAADREAVRFLPAATRAFSYNAP
jgi:hypothetical protein